MKFRKEYGINGLLEWHGIVESHGVRMRVDFTNGGATAWGVSPASFTTDNELTQHIIENCEQFKNGRIRLVKSVAIPGSDDNVAFPTQPTEPEPSHADEPSEDFGNANIINVSDKSEAIEYLKENFPDKNYTYSSLRTKGAFESACRDCGVKFEFTA